MAIEGNWNYTDSQGMSHTIELSKNKVTVDGGEPVRLGKLKGKGSNMLETVYQIPTQTGDDVKLYLKNKNITCVCNGTDVDTGEAYEPVKMPGWIWVFYVLFIADWFLFIGGALGGAANGGGAALCSVIASNSKMKTVAKVFACIGIYIGFTIVEAIVAVALVNAMS